MLSKHPSVKLTFEKRLSYRTTGIEEYVHFQKGEVDNDHYHVSHYTFSQASFYLKTSYSLGINGTEFVYK